jgi:hypothetical protein
MELYLLLALAILITVVPRDKLRFVFKKIISCLLIFFALVAIYYVALVVIGIILLWVLH